MSISTSPVTWLVILGWVVTIGNAVVPVLPKTASVIVGSIVAIATLLTHGQQIRTGKIGKVL